jgi:hypothetical protein
MAANGALPSGIRFTDLLGHRPVPSEGFGPSSLVNSQLTYLLRKFACHMREKSRAFDTSTDQLARYSLLLERLRARFEVGIYTLNYDTVALAAWPDAFTGFTRETYRRNRRRFDPRAVHTRSEWGYLYHLHGSVHHTVADHDSDQPLAEEITWQDDLTDEFEDSHEGRSTDTRSESNEFPRTSLIVGGFKLDQLLIEPYQTLYSSLVRHVYDADAILIGGYGFSDVHVNRALRNRAMSIRSRPRVMILTYSGDEVAPMMWREDSWSRRMMETLDTTRQSFRPTHDHDLVNIRGLKKQNGFDASLAGPVAVWHNGFDEAAVRVEAIISWLDGVDEALRTLS